MGLDISYYEHIQPADPQPQTEEEIDNAYDEGDLCRVYNIEVFADRQRPLKDGWVATSGVCGGFRAGSYGGYNHWREELAWMALGTTPDIIYLHPEDYEGKPFFEQINFADNEGTIGPEVSAILAEAYEEYREKAGEVMDEHSVQTYNNFDLAFQTAADTGMVVWH